MDETVILEPENGTYFTLYSVGTFMIENLQLGNNIEKVIKSVKNTYNVPTSEIESDLKELITNMLEQKLLIKSE